MRTGQATTTLISTNGADILVDPSLPVPALLARLSERTDLKPDQITHVFLTSADPLHRRAITAFENASWLVEESELEAARAALAGQLSEAAEGTDDELVELLERERAVIDRCEPALDSITAGVDLFPLPGVSPGSCGLLLALPKSTVLICGDAVATLEHLEQGKVLPNCHDVEQARESFSEAIEIADLLILGRDNITVNPRRRPFGM